MSVHNLGPCIMSFEHETCEAIEPFLEVVIKIVVWVRRVWVRLDVCPLLQLSLVSKSFSSRPGQKPASDRVIHSAEFKIYLKSKA